MQASTDSFSGEALEQVVQINRVTKVVKGGKHFSFSALVVVGDGNGRVGFGTGKSREVPSAIRKGAEAAKKNQVAIPLHGSTIPHESMGEFGSGRVLLRPARQGRGVVAGGAVRAVLQCAGVQDVIAKSIGSRNPHSVVRATFDGLLQLHDEAATFRLRGRHSPLSQEKARVRVDTTNRGHVSLYPKMLTIIRQPESSQEVGGQIFLLRAPFGEVMKVFTAANLFTAYWKVRKLGLGRLLDLSNNAIARLQLSRPRAVSMYCAFEDGSFKRAVVPFPLEKRDLALASEGRELSFVRIFAGKFDIALDLPENSFPKQMFGILVPFPGEEPILRLLSRLYLESSPLRGQFGQVDREALQRDILAFGSRYLGISTESSL